MPSLLNIYYSEHKKQGAFHIPVILIHGAGSNHLCWSAELRRMSGLHTVALDLPGHGKSPGAGFHELGSYSQALFDFISASGWYRIFLIGHSMGGAIALQFSLDHPDLVPALCLISSAASFSIRPELIESFRSPQTAEIGKQRLWQLISPRKGQKRWYQPSGTSVWDDRPSLWYADFLACSAFDLRSKLPEITSPTLIMAGTDDPLVPFSAASYMATRLPNSELVPYYQNGHMLMLEEPQSTSQKIHEFILRNMPSI